MRIDIAYDKCIASGACALIAPSVFGVDEAGMIVLLDPDPTEEMRQEVEEAAAACPACVITVGDS